MPLASQSVSGWQAKAEAKIIPAIADLMQSSVAHQADIVLVAPPFVSPDRPSLGLHVIAGIANAHGMCAVVVYSNLAFAAAIGPRLYRLLCHTSTEELVGERLFQTAYPGPDPAPLNQARITPDCWPKLCDGQAPDFADVQAIAALWTPIMAAALADLPARYIGLSSVFEQSLSSLALISGIKALDSSKITLLGGANTDGPMGKALGDYCPDVDYIFAGEAEASFAGFLRDHGTGKSDIPRLIAGRNNVTLDDLGKPEYGDFFDQFHATVHESICEDGLDMAQVWLPYESSRGCWWGEKHHCTFCGLNASGMNHRIKSADKVAREIIELAETHDIDRILMVDNIMPHSYFSTFLPLLRDADRKLSLFYEQKANMSVKRMTALRDAGVTSIQPGIESLSTELLQRMRKRSNVQTNLDCLRFARASGVKVVWNLLSDFPGDEEDDYRGMTQLIPYLHHLQPPGGVGGLSIERFSPYHSDPASFDITKITPMAAYAQAFGNADLEALAYHFSGDYTSAIRRNPSLLDDLNTVVDNWDASWETDDMPMFFVFDLDVDKHLIVDTRGFAALDEPRLIDAAEAHLLLRGSAELTPQVVAALDRGQLVEVDGRYGAMACAAPESPILAVTKSDAANVLARA